MKNIRYPALAGLCFGASLMAPVLTLSLIHI